MGIGNKRMADNGNILKLFGLVLSRDKKTSKGVEKQKLASPILPEDNDGGSYVSSGAGHYGQYVNMEGDDAKDNPQLIMRYRGVALHPEIDMAVDEIVNESIVTSELSDSVALKLDDVETTDKIKDQIREEFDKVLQLLRFNELGSDMYRTWYVDGRLVHHLMVDDSNLKAGIQEIRHIDSARIRKVKEVKYKLDPSTKIKLVDEIQEYYVFEDKPGQSQTGVKITTDAISYVTSGVLDESKKKVLSHLHKSLKPLNQLRMMEDSLVIYRLARAPERRIFYIDVGNLPRGKADQYMKDLMSKYRNKLVYDASTGQLKDDRKHMSMLEDFWLPRRENGRGTEISTLPGGDNLGQMDDVLYFQKRLYRSLNVPVSRLEQESTFSLGRSTEISRDEIKFQKFIDHLRRRFSMLFLNILKKQLLLKGIITNQDWDNWKSKLYVDYTKDNHFTELKEMEIFRERSSLMNELVPYVGEYLSKSWIMEKVMRFTEKEIEDMAKDIKSEQSSGEIEDPQDSVPVVKPKATPSKKEEDPPKQKTSDEKEPESDEKKEVYVPSQEDELVEQLTSYMAKINEQD